MAGRSFHHLCFDHPRAARDRKKERIAQAAAALLVDEEVALATLGLARFEVTNDAVRDPSTTPPMRPPPARPASAWSAATNAT
jgi:hypothetical protein